jgi:hypothetical protein
VEVQAVSLTWLFANWKLVGIAALLALLGLQTVRVAELKQDAADRRAVDAESQRLAERAQRTEEQRRAAAIAKGVQDAKPAIQAEARDAAALPDSRLQQPAIRYIRRACANPAPASGSAPAADPIMVFADVLGRIEQRADDLAVLAGKRGTAGALCERSYDALTP